MLQSRSPEESQLYMDLQPCPGCEVLGYEWESHLTEERDGTLVTVYSGACADCGAERGFEFEVIGEAPAAMAFGGPQHSRIIDPGQFLALARQAAALVPARPEQCPPESLGEAREAIAMAVAAMDEVGKFVPADADTVPPDAFTREAGKVLYASDPTLFRRRRIEAVAMSYRDVLMAYEVR